jgi:large subunit ribosomal protein L21
VFAVVQTGGKQYKVAVGDTVDVERLDASPGDEVELDKVLLVADEDNVKVGSPLVAGAVIRAAVVEHRRGKKLLIFKMKSKKRYRRHMGHRQGYTRLTIKQIVL